MFTHFLRLSQYSFTTNAFIFQLAPPFCIISLFLHYPQFLHSLYPFIPPTASKYEWAEAIIMAWICYQYCDLSVSNGPQSFINQFIFLMLTDFASGSTLGSVWDPMTTTHQWVIKLLQSIKTVLACVYE